MKDVEEKKKNVEEEKIGKKSKEGKGKRGNIIAIAVLLLLVGVFIGLLLWNNARNSQAGIDAKDKAKMESFSVEMKEVMAMSKEKGYTYEETQFALSEAAYAWASENDGGVGTDYMVNNFLTTLISDASGSVDSLINNLTETLQEGVDDVMDGLLGGSGDAAQIQISSSTACNDGDIDSKFCVNSLNANVYISDPTSTKWAVIVHGYMMSGSLMYSAVGEMYTSQGWNVIAPDLRGFGSSDGSVAMGYLESLDVYDWIKDLHANPSKYGVNEAPTAVVVHGISLGGATTLQLATNPDIRDKKGAPYTQSLQDLHVVGFVDDCGYTSMSGIITGMLSVGETLELSSILGSLGIELPDFMSMLSDLMGEMSIPGFEGFTDETLSSANVEELLTYVEQFSTLFGQTDQQFINYENGGQLAIPGVDTTMINQMIQQFMGSTGSWQIPGMNDVTGSTGTTDTNNSLWSGFDTTGGSSWSDYVNGWSETASQWTSGTVTGDSNSWPNYLQKETEVVDTSTTLDALVGKVLMALVGVGLNDDNYAYYSNSFAPGRYFQNNQQIVVVHGTADTTVPYNNAGVVAEQVTAAQQAGRNTLLLHKWDITGGPHAGVVVGMNKNEYTSLITNFTKCVTDSSCTSISR